MALNLANQRFAALQYGQRSTPELSKKCGREVAAPVKSDSSGTCFFSSEYAVRGASFSCLVKKSNAHFRQRVSVVSNTRDRGINSKLSSAFFRAAAEDDLVSATD